DVYDFRKYVSDTLAIPIHDVLRLLVRAPYTYKRYEIPKKSGGSRSIAQPAKETKIIQRLLMDAIFSQLPVHECAVAYKHGASIKTNAQQHRYNQYLSKFDFSNFFGSITSEDIAAHLGQCLGDELSEQSVADIARISCIRNKINSGLCLSIGAPSSPVLSNSILYNFDVSVSAWCLEKGIVYTRYADDLSFSSNQKGLSGSIEPFLRQTLKDISYPSLVLNERKTIHVSKKHQRRVTGLVISNDGSVSLGRERKRLISAMIHRCINDKLEEADIYILQGLLGFAQDAEPIFVARMRAKYGSLVIREILRKRVKLPR
ncbi:MAG: retron St85 family RNA-directed DNA polymerase, partial [Pseudomonas sp.]|nr:retron St85 family RNA-directed DNA polymerase [Pseudomonas sp.]